MRIVDLPALLITAIAGILSDSEPPRPGRPQPWMDTFTPTPNLPGEPITDDEDLSPVIEDSTTAAVRRLIDFHSS